MKEVNFIQTAHQDDGCGNSNLAANDVCFDDAVVLDFDPEAEMQHQLQRMEKLLEHQIADFGSIGLSKPQAGKGPTVYIGFDSEFVPGNEEKDNEILSLQFYLMGEFGTLSRVVYPRGTTKIDRPNLTKVIVRLITEAMEEGTILEWPNHVVVCGFFLRIDLQAFGDLASFKSKIENTICFIKNQNFKICENKGVQSSFFQN